MLVEIVPPTLVSAEAVLTQRRERIKIKERYLLFIVRCSLFIDQLSHDRELLEFLDAVRRLQNDIAEVPSSRGVPFAWVVDSPSPEAALGQIVDSSLNRNIRGTALFAIELFEFL